MSRKWAKTLSAAIAATLLAGGSAYAANYTDMITGDKSNDTAYSGIIQSDGTYKFREDSIITTQGSALDASGNVTLDAAGHSLTINTSDEKGLNGLKVSAISADQAVTITAKTLNVNASIDGGDRVDAFSFIGSRGKATLTVNGDTFVQAHNQNVSGDRADGIYTIGNADLIFNGNVTMKGSGDEKWGVFTVKKNKDYFNVSGIYAGPDYSLQTTPGAQVGAHITVNGDVDLAIKGNGIWANGGGSVVTVNGGGTILTDDESDTPYAILASSGHVYMNLNEDKTAAADHKVDIKGQIALMPYSVFPVEVEKNTTISVGISGADSVWTGMAMNGFSDEQKAEGWTSGFTLFLQNGATWNNELYGGGETGAGSTVDHFTGGTSAGKAGNIFQNDFQTLTLKNYTGFTNVYYAHEGEGTSADDYSGYGDTVITNAASGSGITLITDNSGNIDVNDEAKVKSLLNALAGKLIYSAYAKGESNVAGTVKLAEGLTASSQTLKSGDIIFDKTTGQGTYTGEKAPVDEGYTQTVTGDATKDTQYKNVISGYSYVFSGDTTINVKNGNAVIDVPTALADDQSIVYIKSSDGLSLNVSNSADVTYGVRHNVISDERKYEDFGDFGFYNNPVNVSISGKKINISASGKNTAYGVYAASDGPSSMEASNVYLTDASGKMDDTGTANVMIHVTGAKNPTGIFTGSNSKVEVFGSLTVKADDSGSEAVGLHANSTLKNASSQIIVYKDTNLSVNGTGVIAQGDKATVNLQKGVTIKTNADNADPQYALLANMGTINVNSASGDHSKNKVVIDGNIGFNSNGGTINLDLANDQSSFHGTVTKAYVVGGTLNMKLSNGAVWNHETVGVTDPDAFFIGRVSSFTGGASADKAGVILQNDENDLTFDTYSGFTMVIYNHTGDGTSGEDYMDYGDVKINSATAGSGITLSTDNNGIDTTNKDQVAKVLNALAGKLMYSKYALGENNLSGTVQIADGLTGSSQTLKSGEITFDKDNNGRGTYVAPATSEFTQAITGDADADTDYVNAGVLKDGKYTFDKDTSITLTGSTPAINAAKDVIIDAGDHALSVKTSNDADTGKAYGVQSNGKAKLDITAGKLAIDVSSQNTVYGLYFMKGYNALIGEAAIHGDLDVKAAAKNGATAVYAANGTLTIDGNVTSHVSGTTNGVGNNSANNIYALGSMSVANVLVKGDVDLSGNGNGLNAYGSGSAITVGGGKISVDQDNTAGYAALFATNATVNMNVNDDKSAAGTHDVNVKGNILTQTSGWASQNSVVNLGLSTAKSTLEGVVQNNYPDGDNNGAKGIVNLWLQNGASWTNAVYGKTLDGFEGSHVTSLTGGADAKSAGHIFQRDSHALTVDNYSGWTNVYYAHEGDGTEASQYKAGDTIITKAAAGSGITLVTDNSGKINVSDKTKVDALLNALAGKLVYSAFASGEKNLTGSVKLADGLTASSKELAVGDITFDAATGRGTYGTVTPPITNSFTQVLTGDKAKDTAYAGVIQSDGSYKFTEDTTITVNQMTRSDKIVLDPSYGEQEDVSSAAIQLDKNVKNLAINADQALTLKVFSDENTKAPNETPGILANKLPVYGVYNAVDGGNVTIKAGTLNIQATSDYTRLGTQNNKIISPSKAYGLYAGNSNGKETSHIQVTGDVNIQAKGFGNVYGIDAEGNSSIHVAGNVAMKGENGAWGIDTSQGVSIAAGKYLSAAAVRSYGDGSSVTVDGNVDIASQGAGLTALGGGTVNVAGGTVLTEDNSKLAEGEDISNSAYHYAIAADLGTVNMNMNADKTGSGSQTVKLSGNVGLAANISGQGYTGASKSSVVNLGLSGKDSTWTGLAVDGISKDQKANGYSGTFNLYLNNGATWTNEVYGTNVSDFAGSHVTKLVGGATEALAGHIFQNDSHGVTIDSYSGFTNVFYAHTGDGTAAENYKAGDTIITKAAAGSSISLITDNSGITMTDTDQVKKALNALAGKLIYTAYTTGEKNLTGTVKIADGLTASSKVQKYGDISFDDKTGQGGMTGDVKTDDTPVQPDPDQPGGDNKPGDNISEGDYETYVMKGIRSAATTNMHAWRDNVSDLYDASELADEDGIFAKVLGGKTEANTAGIHEDNSYWGGQVGYDKKVANGWHTGVAFDYRDGDSTYLLGGTGDDKLYSLGIYAKKAFDNGSHVKVALKAGQVENDYTVYNEIRSTALDGKYKASAVGLTAEYGKTYGSDRGYFMPKVQLSWSRVGSDDYTARTAGGATIEVHQEAYNSLVGRLGFEAGSRNARGGFYAGLNLAHEFDGDINSSYYANDGGAKKTSYEGKDTWLELVLGGRYQLSENTQFYADFARDFGGDFEHKWKLNAGLKWSF